MRADNNAFHDRRTAAMTSHFSVMERLFREWMPHLSEAEMKLAGFVITNTLGRGREDGHYYAEQIIDGIKVKDSEEFHCAGTGLSKRALMYALKTCVERGLLTKKTGRNAGWVLAINPAWNPTGTNVIEEGNIAMLKVGSKPKKGPKNTSLRARANGIEPGEVSANFASDECKICTHPNTNNFQEQTEEEFTTFTLPGSPDEPENENLGSGEEGITGEEAKNVSRFPAPFRQPRRPANPVSAELPLARDEKSGRRVSEISEFEKAWRGAFQEAVADKVLPETAIPARWGAKQGGLVKLVARDWSADTYGPFEDFLGFVVKHWSQIIRAKFSWMTQTPAPTTPDIGFLCTGKFLPKFLDVFCEAETLKWMGTLPGTEPAIRAQMQAGLSREAAILEVARLQMLDADRKERAADIARATRTYRMAELAADRARKEAATREKYRPTGDRTPKASAPASAASYEAGAPIHVEHVDFSAWGIDE